jgi:hypothetical protein
LEILIAIVGYGLDLLFLIAGINIVIAGWKKRKENTPLGHLLFSLSLVAFGLLLIPSVIDLASL